MDALLRTYTADTRNFTDKFGKMPSNPNYSGLSLRRRIYVVRLVEQIVSKQMCEDIFVRLWHRLCCV